VPSRATRRSVPDPPDLGHPLAVGEMGCSDCTNARVDRTGAHGEELDQRDLLCCHCERRGPSCGVTSGAGGLHHLPTPMARTIRAAQGPDTVAVPAMPYSTSRPMNSGATARGNARRDGLLPLGIRAPSQLKHATASAATPWSTVRIIRPGRDLANDPEIFSMTERHKKVRRRAVLLTNRPVGRPFLATDAAEPQAVNWRPGS